jgi:predicted glutamine amidotransferase
MNGSTINLKLKKEFNMCGLVAMISKTQLGFGQREKTMFSQMLYTNALRGFDSTGAFSINKYGNLDMIKSAQPASGFLITKTYDDFIDKAYTNGRVLVGHNRAATKGAKTDENAHPFIEGDTCLVHNGTLHSHKHLKDVTVDSHAITHSIDERGFEKTYQDLHGAFALIWYDAKEKRLNIVRNKERPLWVLTTEDVDFIASEPDMLTWLYERNYGGSHKVQTTFFDTENQYYYDMDNLKTGLYKVELPEKKHLPVLVPAKQTKILDTVGTKTGQTTKKGYGPLSGYNYNDEVTFKIINYSINMSGTYVIQGEILDKDKTKCTAVDSSITHEDMEEMISSEYCKGTVYGASWKQGICTVVLQNPEIIEIYTSCNGETFTEDEFYEEVVSCTECGDFLNPVEQDGLFWVRRKSGKVKATKCMHCVAKDPHLQKLIGEIDA